MVMHYEPVAVTLFVDVSSQRSPCEILPVLHLSANLLEPYHPRDQSVYIDRRIGHLHRKLGKGVERNRFPRIEHGLPPDRHPLTILMQSGYVVVMRACRRNTFDRACRERFVEDFVCYLNVIRVGTIGASASRLVALLARLAETAIVLSLFECAR
jgi:hypothetical protein